MALTNFGALTTEQLTVWSRDTWMAARNAMFVKRFLGDDENAMIQRITELKKSDKGARAVITLVTDLEGDGVAGDRSLKGNEEGAKAFDQVIRIDQLRNANKSEGRMAEQKSVVAFRETSKNVLAYWVADRTDQMAFLTLTGVAYTSKNNGAARTGSDLPNLEFAADVTAPTANRHRRWVAASGSLAAGDTTAVVATDTPSWKMLIEAKAYAKDNYIKPIKGEMGMELYNVFMTPRGLAKLKNDADFLAAWRHAMPRDSKNPLFAGADVIYVDGLAIYEYRHVYNTTGLASGSKWGSGGTVDGNAVLLCGSQALGFADIGDPYWVEEDDDYGNQQGISLGKICGLKKPVFRSIHSGTNEDFGVLRIDTAI